MAKDLEFTTTGGATGTAAPAMVVNGDDQPVPVKLIATGAVTIEVNEADLANVGAKADAAAADDTGAYSLIALVKRALQNWTTLLAKIPALVSGRIPVEAALAAGEAHVGEVGGNLITISAEYTVVGGATPYSQYDLIGSNPMALLRLQHIFRKVAGTGYITGISLAINTKSLTPAIRCHFFNKSDATVSADNAAWQDKYADSSKRMGYLDLPACTTAQDTTNSDMSRAFDMTLRHRVFADAADDSLYVGFELASSAALTLAAGAKISLKVTVDNN